MSIQSLTRTAQDDGGQSGREGEEESEVTGTDSNVVTSRQIAGVEWGRPLAIGWSGHLGINYQRAKCINERGKTLLKDMYDQPLTFSRGPSDTMMLALLRAVYSGRGDSQLVVSNGSKPCHCPSTTLLAPISTGSANPWSRPHSVTCAPTPQAACPQPKATAFFDYGSDLDSGASVVGDPAGVRGKPGSGFGYGGGVRIDSPIGPLRLEYGLNDLGARRFHFASAPTASLTLSLDKCQQAYIIAESDRLAAPGLSPA
ncbi:hypothetical protein WJX84_001035 [Apatococcus fuscideae]|uniref:Bacterial surface antigen (D15) domain-containing protein n=1 Tax=Apatococcus fuscideae TaxID=2026836 RepID=A0AAW1T951_9CHLO